MISTIISAIITKAIGKKRPTSILSVCTYKNIWENHLNNMWDPVKNENVRKRPCSMTTKNFKTVTAEH